MKADKSFKVGVIFGARNVLRILYPLNELEDCDISSMSEWRIINEGECDEKRSRPSRSDSFI